MLQCLPFNKCCSRSEQMYNDHDSYGYSIIPSSINMSVSSMRSNICHTMACASEQPCPPMPESEQKTPSQLNGSEFKTFAAVGKI